MLVPASPSDSETLPTDSAGMPSPTPSARIPIPRPRRPGEQRHGPEVDVIVADGAGGCAIGDGGAVLALESVTLKVSLVS